jgi:polysaccharide biosynthesis/export protein
MKTKLIYLLSTLILVSCGPTRNLAYFSDLDEQAVYTESITNATQPKIQPDDLLSITVSSPNAEANILFNKGVAPAMGGVSDFGVTNRAVNIHDEGYLVDKNGYIDFPVLGQIKFGGLTKDGAKAKLIKELDNYLKEPIVNIRFLNYKVTVIGEVNRPSTFTIPTEKINILEALGLAGDMTAFGKRDNVLVIREQEGTRTVARLNLNSNQVLNSPYFYLQQNDVVYVEPDKGKAIQNNPNNRWIPVAAAAVSATVILITNLLIR